MTEADWLTCEDPMPMLDWLRRSRKAGDRKLRLFSVGCCRSIWTYLVDERSRRAVEVAEAFADGLLGRQCLVVARDDARDAKTALHGLIQTPQQRAANAAFNATRDTGSSAANNALGEAARVLSFDDHNQCAQDEFRRQADLLRCIFGNPFSPSTKIDDFCLTHNDAAVPRLARAIYDERAFDRLTELADALDEAGCRASELLTHLRGAGPHVRSCWAVDLLLGNS